MRQPTIPHTAMLVTVIPCVPSDFAGTIAGSRHYIERILLLYVLLLFVRWR